MSTSLIGTLFENDLKQTFFSEEHSEELHEDYCLILFNSFGSFHPIQNPAAKVFDRTEYYSRNAVCSLCNVETDCTVHAATRTTNVFLICKPCIQDFNMHVFNPSNKEYCRALKQKR